MITTTKKIIAASIVTAILFSLILLAVVLGISYAETSQDLLKQGIDYYNKGDFKNAVSELQKAIIADPANKKLWKAYNDAYQADTATRFMATLTGAYNAITYDETLERQKQNPDIFLIDLRSAKDYDEEHIPNAVNIPLEELKNRISELPELKITETVVYCAAGPRSATGQMYLSMLGYTNVKYLRGGIMAYREYKGKQKTEESPKPETKEQTGAIKKIKKEK